MTTLTYAASSLITVSGRIKDFTVGEIDPYIIGDACLIEISINSRETVALLTDYQSCVDYPDDISRLRYIDVVVESKNRITNQKMLSILKLHSKAKWFYEVEYGAIENGLED